MENRSLTLLAQILFKINYEIYGYFFISAYEKRKGLINGQAEQII